MPVKKNPGPAVEVVEQDLSDPEELPGDAAEDPINIKDILNDIGEAVDDMKKELDLIIEEINDIKEHLGDSENAPQNIEEPPDGIEQHLGDTEDDVEDVESGVEAYPDNAEGQRSQDKESISSRMKNLDGRIRILGSSIPTLETIKSGSKSVSHEYVNTLLGRIQHLEARLAVEEKGRARAEELNKALLLSASRSARSPSPEPRAASPPIYPPSSRAFRSTRAARPPTRARSHRSLDSRISKRGSIRRSDSFTYTSTRHLTFAERMSRGAWRQRRWVLGGAAVGAAGAALWMLAVNREVEATGKMLMNFVRWIDQPYTV